MFNAMKWKKDAKDVRIDMLESYNKLAVSQLEFYIKLVSHLSDTLKWYRETYLERKAPYVPETHKTEK